MKSATCRLNHSAGFVLMPPCKLVTEAAKGAESAGVHIEKIDLYKMEKFTGCISCFGCKIPAGQNGVIKTVELFG